ncbi:HAD family hydrolase [Melioribacteraceae bacterium 4301-Me]|uniref:HAD family hydrolase n=1 Tax=Pyranulibacter aquaticus TaxID=3163344 RepID=UPI00359559C3
MNHPSVIVFDLGNVLIPFDYSIIIKKFNEIDNGLGDRFLKLYKENYHVHRDYEKSAITTEEFLTIMMEWTEHKIEKEDFCKYFSNIFIENKELTAILPSLKKYYKLILLSNTNYIHRKYGWGNYSFLNYFDKLILSYEVKAIKPEEKIYRTVESYTQLPSSEHLFIDDVLDYVEGAKKCGWDGIQFQNNRQLITELNKRNIILNGIN